MAGVDDCQLVAVLCEGCGMSGRSDTDNSTTRRSDMRGMFSGRGARAIPIPDNSSLWSAKDVE